MYLNVIRRFESALTLPVVAIFALAVSPALASDGVVEINQAVAEAGLLSGDSAGFPVTLATSGSYRLTSDLTVPASPAPLDVTILEITGANVTLDLNGFSLESVNACSGSPLSCTHQGQGSGITIQSSGTNARIMNGNIDGAPGVGIYALANSRIKNVTVQNSGSAGISLIYGGEVRGAFVFDNMSDGIIGENLRIDDTVSRNNGGGGFSLAGSNSLTNSVAARNGADGAFVEAGIVRGNLFEGNTVYGLVPGGFTGWGDNVMIGHPSGDVSPGGTQLSTNVCGSSTC